jgi:serine/threonine protein phosphatase PrpC
MSLFRILEDGDSALIWCGCRVNGNLNLSRAIGDLKYKSNEHLPAAAQIISAEPDVTETSLSPNDYFLVLACDGVWDVMSNQVRPSRPL